jgi:hypothetical protein
MHSLLSRAAHLCARCWLFLAHVTPTRPPLLRQYVVPRSAHGRRFSQAAQKDTRRIKSSFPQSILFLYLFFIEPRFLKEKQPQKPHNKLQKAQMTLRENKLNLELKLGGESDNPTSKGIPQPPLWRKSIRGA